VSVERLRYVVIGDVQSSTGQTVNDVLTGGACSADERQSFHDRPTDRQASIAQYPRD